MIHSDNEYPYHHDELPSLKQVLQTVEWDVVCVFDACRWDAFNEVCDDSEPVRSPGSNTPTWTQQVWCDPEADWSDVTYISGNPLTTQIRDDPSREGVIEDHVGEYVEAWADDIDADVWNHSIGTADPSELSNLAMEYEPPMVVHYMQPHTPFVGTVSLRVDGDMGAFPGMDELDPDCVGTQEYHMVEKGHVSPEYARLAYLKNLELVWRASREFRKLHDRVITTADHGEKLGPDKWDHGGPFSPQSRVVPFHTRGFKPDLPTPSALGAADDHEWVMY